MNLKHKIIIDTDIGDDVDDAFAIALALKSPSLDLVGITTVFKNSNMRSKIVKAEIEAFGKKGIDVVSGLDKPLVVPPSTFSYETIGDDGKPIITAYDESYVSGADAFDAPNYLLKKAKEFPREITLIAIGPLTNLAKAIDIDPEGFKLFKEIIMMGGSNQGVKEWNYICDPQAAEIVLNSGVPIRIIPIECTILCEVKENHYKKLLNPINKEQSFLLDMYQRWRKNQTRPCQMHDCLAVQELIQSYCNLKNVNISVSLSENEIGRTIIRDDGELNAKIAVSVRCNEFMNHLFEVLYS